jgi:hypothetical protein
VHMRPVSDTLCLGMDQKRPFLIHSAAARGLVSHVSQILVLIPYRLSQAPLQPVQRGLPASSAQRIRFLSYILAYGSAQALILNSGPDKRLTL